MLNYKWIANVLKTMEFDAEAYLKRWGSRRGVQCLAPESLCSPSYEGLKVHMSQNTILEKCKKIMEIDAETYLKR